MYTKQAKRQSIFSIRRVSLNFPFSFSHWLLRYFFVDNFFLLSLRFIQQAPSPCKMCPKKCLPKSSTKKYMKKKTRAAENFIFIFLRCVCYGIAWQFSFVGVSMSLGFSSRRLIIILCLPNERYSSAFFALSSAKFCLNGHNSIKKNILYF